MIEQVTPQEPVTEQNQLTLALNDHEAMELTRCEGVIKEGQAVFVEVGNALWTIRESRLYRETHRNFDEYLQERWHMGKSNAGRLISAAAVYHQLEHHAQTYPHTLLSPDGDVVLPANEAQSRPLSALPAEQRPEAWARAVDEAQGQPASAAVQAVVDEMLPAKSEKAPDLPAAVAPLFEVEDQPEGQSRFVPPAPLNAQGNNAPRSAAEPKSAAETLAALNQERDDAIAGWKEGDEPAEEQPETVISSLDKDALDQAAEAIDGVEVAAPALPSKPAATAAPASPPAAKPVEAKPAPAPAAPPLPAGFTTAIVKEADYKAAMERGLWPLASVLETVTELEEQVKVLEAGELSQALVEASPSVPLYPPPSEAMVLAGVSATRLTEINATAGTVLYHSETQILDELFPGRETTGPDHIVAVLVTARLREMNAKTQE